MFILLILDWRKLCLNFNQWSCFNLSVSKLLCSYYIPNHTSFHIPFCISRYSVNLNILFSFLPMPQRLCECYGACCTLLKIFIFTKKHSITVLDCFFIYFHAKNLISKCLIRFSTNNKYKKCARLVY